MPAARMGVWVTAAAVLASCGQHAGSGSAPLGTSTATEVPSNSAPSVFAFTTANQLNVVRDGTVVSTATAPAELRNPVFTTSGKYVAATADDGTIMVAGLDAQSGRAVPAHVTQVFADRGDTITWWQGPNQLFSLDLSQRSSAPTTTQIDLPGGNPEDTRMISLADGIAVFARPGLPDGGEELITMDRDHTFHRLGPSPEIAHPIQATVPRADGQKFAYSSPIRSACPKSGVGVLDTNSGQVSSPAMPYDVDSIATPLTMWWDTDHFLRMSLATRPCGSDATSSTVETWKLDQDGWVRADPADVLVSRELGGNKTALVTPTSTKPPRGTLWVDSGADRVHIADNVTDLAAPDLSPPNDS